VVISLFIAGLRGFLHCSNGRVEQRCYSTTLDLGARSRGHDAASLSDRALGFSAQGLMQF
jgi:hypothetical protein